MANHPTDSNNHANDDSMVIKASDFSPLDSHTKSRGISVSLPAISIVLSLLISAVILWFLMTAKTLIVEVVPADAEINIDGLSFQLSGNFLLRQGSYTVIASAPGYHESHQEIKVSKAKSQELSFELEKLPGHLLVDSQPSGADVVVDGKTVGKTPYKVMSLSPKQHRIQLVKPRYQVSNADVIIEGLDKTQTLSANLIPDWGVVNLTTIPNGARVSVAGEYRGVTPLSVEVLSSGESVVAKLVGYKQWEATLKLKAGETKNIPAISLQHSDGLLAVTSQPSNASVTVNGQFKGLTPLELELKPGHEQTLRFFLDGYQSASRRITLESGKEQNMLVQLPPLQGEVRILAHPEDASIYINGKLADKKRRSFVLPAKAQTVEVRKKGYASHRRVITPKVGVEQVVKIRLQTEQQARWANTPKVIDTVAAQRLKLFRPQQTFTMGASRREAGRRSNEVLRKVTLERAFYFSEKAVTNSQYKQFDRQHSSKHASGVTLDRHNQPVVSVSWQQAARYCNWLSEQQSLTPFYIEIDGKITGVNKDAKGYRLPTEAEWSWAARYKNQVMQKFSWGVSYPPSEVVGNYADRSGSKILAKVLVNYNDGAVAASPVGTYPANEKGLYDLGSNVAEWVNDFYGIELGLSLKNEIDPLGPEEGQYRVIRGASWRESSITELRLSFRDYGNDGRDDLGFRVARYAE